MSKSAYKYIKNHTPSLHVNRLLDALNCVAMLKSKIIFVALTINFTLLIRLLVITFTHITL
ncbi:hypothetical protein HanXRQr2_Chr14g0640491 [Helianthus annuus]|uniref:Uncharacterized protein n=1 Tax=Helianthus annuus TaxID=4232 RepID=A0A9K3H685_HELAN|nr:hypothetical protein HanXRQr2_Chr14g0640491 [Helianthus annuus]